MLKKWIAVIRQRRWMVLALLGTIALAWGGWSWWNKPDSAKQQFVTQTISRGNLAVNVTATGTLQATNNVDVSSELSGTVAKVFADYNDPVKKGQVLVTLDTTKLLQAIEGSLATLHSRQAAVAQARATLKEYTTSLVRQEEVSRLSGGKVPSATELDASRAKVERAQADLAAAEANAAVATATLRSNETDLTKATIRSPVNGVVITRSIEPGQTVAASLSAPVLFTLAEDLTEMELIVLVAEADVGQVKSGLKAQFTVDAFPGKNYSAAVSKVRFGSKTVDNVVSYQTVLTVKNKDLSLLPGMTASADILVMEKQDVLLIPNAALRFKPVEATAAPSSGGVMSMLMPRPPGRNQGPAVATTRASNRASGTASGVSGRRGAAASAPDAATLGMTRGKIWIKTADGEKQAVQVMIGASDGKFTEVRSRELKAGDSVITGVVVVGKS